MSTPNLYNLIFFEKDKYNPLWKVEYDDLEMIAGMLAVSVGILYDINRDNKSYNIDTNINISEYKLLSEIIEDDIPVVSIGKLDNDEYGIWLRSSKRFHYDLYRFRTNKFFQGIVSMCHNFGVDFRNYFFGYPFDKNGNLYALDNYIMTPYQRSMDVPDLNDIDIENQDDENIIEPLARTDEIVNDFILNELNEYQPDSI